jgi:hypothetical protein
MVTKHSLWHREQQWMRGHTEVVMKAHGFRPEKEAFCELCRKWCTIDHLASKTHQSNLDWLQNLEHLLGPSAVPGAAAAAAAAAAAVDEPPLSRADELQQAFNKGFGK